MRVDRVSVGFGYTMAPRQYETLRFDVRLEAAVEEGEDWAEVVRALHGEAKAEVRREVASSTGRAAAAEVARPAWVCQACLEEVPGSQRATSRGGELVCEACVRREEDEGRATEAAGSVAEPAAAAEVGRDRQAETEAQRCAQCGLAWPCPNADLVRSHFPARGVRQ